MIQKDKEKYAQQEGRDYPLLRYYIATRRLGEAAKFCLKLYDSSKSEMHFFWQIYLEFMQVLAKNGLPMQKRETLIRTKPNLPLQMVLLFWQKFLTVFPIEQLIQQQKLIVEDVVKFNVRLLITQYKFAESIEVLKRFGAQISDPIAITDFYRSIYELERKDEWRTALISRYEELFRNNMNIAQYTPLYDLYNDYLNLLVAEGLKAEKLELMTEVDKAVRFNSSCIAGDKLSHYVSSLASEYHDSMLPAADTKLDYYKTSLKILLAQLIVSTNKVAHPQREFYLQEYVRHFGKTYTFVEEFIVLCP